MRADLKKLLAVDRQFQTSVNLQLDRENPVKFRGYIPTASAAALLKQYLKDLSRTEGAGSTLLIGPYGKGKSHLLLVLLSLLDKSFPEELPFLLERMKNVDGECAELAERAAMGKPYLTVLVTDTGSGLKHAFLLALHEALKRNGFGDLMPESYYSEAVRAVERWREEYPQTFQEFTALLEEASGGKRAGKAADTAGGKRAGEAADIAGGKRTGEAADIAGGKRAGDMARQFLAGLKEYDREALKWFCGIYPRLTSGSEFQPLLRSDVLQVYREINRRLCGEYGYAGIYIVFDEFSKYVEGFCGEGFPGDMKILQDMCELANNSADEKVFLTLVAHKSLKEYGNRISREALNAFRGVEGRLKERLFVVSVRNHFDLIRCVLKKTDEFAGFIAQADNGAQIERMEKEAYTMPFFRTQFTETEFKEIVSEGCFPLTPLAAALLLDICEKAAQNERTVFTFLAGDESGSLLRRLGRSGETGKLYLGAEIIYDYFTPVFRELTDRPEIHNEWLKAEYALKKTEDEVRRDIIKAAALLQIAGSREELPVTVKNAALAAGIPVTLCSQAMEELREEQLLVWRSRLGVYAFKNNVGVNLEEEMERLMAAQAERLPVAELTAAVSDLEYILPKSYNQHFTITRYFQYVYMETAAFLKMDRAEYLFGERFSDGKIICLMYLPGEGREDVAEKVRSHTAELEDSRLVVLLPGEGFGQVRNLRRMLAVKKLLGDLEFLEENRVLEQELRLYQEDILFEINAALEADYLPENGRCRVFHCGEEHRFEDSGQFNHFLSGICGSYYSFSPRINHELLNIRNVCGQYLRARNAVVEDLLSGESAEKYRRGTSPEALVYRTSLVRTGVIGEEYPPDPGTARILEQIRRFFLSGAVRQRSFGRLYDKLQGKDFGVRKGVLPVFLALELSCAAGMPVLYLKDREVECSAEILNNINEEPDRYSLLLEKNSAGKEACLERLESFLGLKTTGVVKNSRLKNIVDALRRRYRALPKLSCGMEGIEQEEWENALKRIGEAAPAFLQDGETAGEAGWKRLASLAGEEWKGWLRRAEINPREFLFDKVPRSLAQPEANEVCAYSVQIIFLIWQERFSYLQEKMADEALILFGSGKGESLAGCLRKWYGELTDRSRQTVLSARAGALLRFIKEIEGYDNREIFTGLAYSVSGVFLEDWSAEMRREFGGILLDIKREIEGAGRRKALEGQKKIIFTGKNGELLERYIRTEENGVGGFLKNAIREAMDEFGESMETAQKAAVLVEALEELLG